MSFGYNTNNASHLDADVCKICGKPATGIHYGVASCEGCKAFYRRSVTKKLSNRCAVDCKFYTDKRELCQTGRCQTCRFQKCILAGMDLRASTRGRIPNKLKQTKASISPSSIRQDLEELRCSTTPGQVAHATASGMLPAALTPDDPGTSLMPRKVTMDLVPCTSRAISVIHRRPNIDPEVTIKGVENALRIAYGSQLQMINECFSLSDRYGLVEASRKTPSEVVANAAFREIKHIATRFRTFLDRLPGFDSFPAEDLHMIIREKWLEMWAVIHSSAWKRNEMYWLIENTNIQFSKSSLGRVIHPRYMWHLISIIELINKVAVTELELYLLMAVLILQPGPLERNVQDPVQLHLIHSHYMDALLKLLAARRNYDQGSFENLRTLLVKLGATHEASVAYFRALDWSFIPWKAANDEELLDEMIEKFQTAV